LYIHNDLLPNNLLTDKEGNVYIIDFENVLYEKKWILTDIVDLALNINDMSLDVKLINDYIKKLKDIKINEEELNINAQLRLIILKRIIQAISSRNFEKEQKKELWKFLNDTFLIKENYYVWLESQGGSIGV
jgi:thiamine kinase-like enzyme